MNAFPNPINPVQYYIPQRCALTSYGIMCTCASCVLLVPYNRHQSHFILFLIIELHINLFFNQPEKCQMRKDRRYVCDRYAVYNREFPWSTNMSWIDSIAHLNFSVIFALHFYALVTQINRVEYRKKKSIHIISNATIVRERLVEKKYGTTILKNIHSICLAQLLHKSLALVVFEYLSLLHYVFSYWSIQTMRKRPFKLNFNVIRYSLVGRPISVTQIKRVYKVTLDGNTETSLVNWKSP